VIGHLRNWLKVESYWVPVRPGSTGDEKVRSRQSERIRRDTEALPANGSKVPEARKTSYLAGAAKAACRRWVANGCFSFVRIFRIAGVHSLREPAGAKEKSIQNSEGRQGSTSAGDHERDARTYALPPLQQTQTQSQPKILPSERRGSLQTLRGDSQRWNTQRALTSRSKP